MTKLPLLFLYSIAVAVAHELYKSMLPAFSKDGDMNEKGIRDALKRETERMALKEETPLWRNGLTAAQGSAT